MGDIEVMVGVWETFFAARLSWGNKRMMANDHKSAFTFFMAVSFPS